MNSYAATAVLILGAGFLLVLPLVPAILELQRKTDAQPLSVIQQHAGEIRHFADGFRSYIKTLEPALHEAGNTRIAQTGSLPDATQYLVLGSSKEALNLPIQEKDELCPVLIAARMDLSLPPDTTFSKDIYSQGRLLGATRNKYRAILGEKDVYLGAESSVTRWVHAVGEFEAGPGCELRGRISSDRHVQLQLGCSFQRLNAPCIEFGSRTIGIDTANSSLHSGLSATFPRSLIDGDFEIPGQLFRGNLVVRGTLRIRTGAQVFGDVKGDRGVIVEEGVQLQGSLISANTMSIGSKCRIHGPVIAERSLSIKRATVLGTSQAPTTVSAPSIEVQEGVIVFGTLWARDKGRVVANS
jgi:predicted acyltransferase (DUF342 family)